MNNFALEDIEKFLIDIYVIGYKNQGESIYIRLKTDDNSFFKDILIDCYATDYNRTMELLEKVKVENNYINYICVSHYHDDHIKEIDKVIKKYSKKDTVILMPNVDREDSLSDLAKEVRTCIAERRVRGRRNYGHVRIISNPETNIMFETIEGYNNKINVGINAITPYSDITVVNATKSIDEINQNDYSIALVLSINGLNILLSSDIMNNTIRMIEKQGDIHYLKIPHHSSNDSDKIFEKIDMLPNTICVSTNYKSSGLPNKRVLNLYNEKTNYVYVTYSDSSNDDYGIVHTRYIMNLNNNEIRFGTECLNNSQKYEKEDVWKVV